jgi:hypothetical protein
MYRDPIQEKGEEAPSNPRNEYFERHNVKLHDNISRGESGSGGVGEEVASSNVGVERRHSNRLNYTLETALNKKAKALSRQRARHLPAS